MNTIRITFVLPLLEIDELIKKCITLKYLYSRVSLYTIIVFIPEDDVHHTPLKHNEILIKK